MSCYCFGPLAAAQTALSLKPVFHLTALFAQREVKIRIRHCDWLKLAAKEIHREQVGTVPTFLSVCVNKVAK